MRLNLNERSTAWPALLGIIAWFGAVMTMQLGWAAALFLLAPLAAIPLAMTHGKVNTPVRWLAFAAAMALIAAYGCDRGDAAAALTLPWLLFCFGQAVNELRHWPVRRNTAKLLMCAYLTVGACWLTLARYGLRPLGFEDVIVHATAMHFHYAGFILPTLLLRLIPYDRTRTTKWVLAGVLAGMPLVAAGITLTVWGHHWLEAMATAFFVAACLLAAWLQARFALSLTRSPPKYLLFFSAASLTMAMALAMLYALGQFLETRWLEIPVMLRFHGGLQVFGFALPALLAWRLIDVSTHRPSCRTKPEFAAAPR